MKLHGLLLTRDDDDIIGECISHALTWCDALYIFDTGSSDNTRDIVSDFSKNDKRVVRVNKTNSPILMDSGLRGYVFNLVRHMAKQGDWFVQVDVDEFYHQNPRDFISSNISGIDTAVWNITYEFRLTESEVDDWSYGRETIENRRISISERRRWYNVLQHSEPRMFKYRNSMSWTPYISYPYNMGFVSENRIAVRHYPQRDPLQLRKRWLLRKLLAGISDPNWKHWSHSDWMDLVAKKDEPGLLCWKKGEDLPLDPEDYHHLPVWYKRQVQYLMHRFLVNSLDRFRPQYETSYEPRIIPDDINQVIISQLKEFH
jgi:hypothetical protein